MKLIYLLLFSISVFLLSLVGYKKNKSVPLYALAIGGIVNANFYHSIPYPINCFGIIFGIDSFVYVLFAFCIVIMYLKEGKKATILLSISSIAAIMIAAIMNLSADLMSDGSSIQEWKTFFTFTASSVASIIGVVIFIKTFDKIKLNECLKMIIGILIISSINLIIYYLLFAVINGWDNYMTKILLGNIIGRFLAVIISLLPYFLMKKIDSKVEISNE